MGRFYVYTLFKAKMILQKTVYEDFTGSIDSPSKPDSGSHEGELVTSKKQLAEDILKYK